MRPSLTSVTTATALVAARLLDAAPSSEMPMQQRSIGTYSAAADVPIPLTLRAAASAESPDALIIRGLAGEAVELAPSGSGLEHAAETSEVLHGLESSPGLEAADSKAAEDGYKAQLEHVRQLAASWNKLNARRFNSGVEHGYYKWEKPWWWQRRELAEWEEKLKTLKSIADKDKEKFWETTLAFEIAYDKLSQMDLAKHPPRFDERIDAVHQVTKLRLEKAGLRGPF